MNYEKYMSFAIENAKKAIDLKEIPIGCVIVKDSKVIASGYNMVESTNNCMAHAEIIAISKACSYLNAWRLIGCDLFVTLEPCVMCMGAIINSRITNLIYGANNTKYGGCVSAINILQYSNNRKLNIINGILSDKCGELITEFFKNLRSY